MRRGGKGEHAVEVVVLGLSALVVVVGLGARRHESEGGDDTSSAESPRPAAELPAGASPTPASRPSDVEDGCHFEDRGYGRYGQTHKLSMGRLLVHADVADEDGSYELLIHTHGAEPVRRLLAPEELDLVIAVMDAGTVSSDYDRAVPDADAIGRWIEAIDAKTSQVIGREAHARRVTFSSWSAGYAAMDAALDHASRWEKHDEAPRLGGLILLDSLHASFGADGEQIVGKPLEPFLDAARRAAKDGPLLFLSHSAIQTDGYASTTQVADHFLHALDVHAEAVLHGGDDLLQLRRRFERGRLFIAGYEGGDREAHCAHLRLLPGILTEQILDRAAR